MADEPVRRLDTWKAIASHLGRSDRTVQRWHALYRFPVHQVGGRSGVFAYTDEIENWLRHDGRRVGAGRLNSARSPLIEMPSTKAGTEAIGLSSNDSPKLSGMSPASGRIDAGYQMWRQLSRNNLQGIAEAFREAIDLDPFNPEAYAGLSHALMAQGMIGSLSLRSAYSSARVAIETALKFDPASPEAMSALAWLKMTSDRDWDGAGQIFDDLLNRSPGNTRAMVGRGLLCIAQGIMQPASALLYAASERDPLSSLSLGLHSWSEYLTGNYTEVRAHIAQAHASGRFGPILASVDALTSIQVDSSSVSISYIERLLDQDPSNELVRGTLGYATGRSGEKAKARAIRESLTNCASHARYMPHYAVALTHLGLDQKQEAIQSMILSYNDGSLWSLGFHLDPALRSLEQETDFRDFVGAAYPILASEQRRSPSLALV